ncbi:MULTISPECIES: hypothetical protein [Candidatus Neomicrothrix]|uniref:Uncharacterized protein n=1 Tax=Candidatus Neomicrothrix parvicella RN1 TaxID=1229780 RepID=R4Z0J9_9ACTN|nr:MULTISPECIES: hypothetical protein [Microthrix]NLH67913.1 hypothetical protein [Candidatus Microthrix parvicella]MBL0203587.1 hypothetical protein [Candidatus Microthrix sp.]MBP7404102.1 hypothetical protein [Candidatus Microthrix sp.]MBP7877540.1 hypothetical protein [Candidatus Microthrix sp.]MBP9620642.1 hypothetical protein [Candidatus Microthrix sp.]
MNSPANDSSPKKSVDARLFIAAGVGGLITLIGLVLLLSQNAVAAALMIVPLLVLLAGLYWMKLADTGTSPAESQTAHPHTGLAQIPQQPIQHGDTAPPNAASGGAPDDDNLAGDTPTVRADRPRLRAAKAYNLTALMKERDNVTPAQCPNCGQLARLSANGDRSRARCADCGAEWALGDTQPPTLVRSHVRTNAPTDEPTQPAGASTAQQS